MSAPAGTGAGDDLAGAARVGLLSALAADALRARLAAGPVAVDGIGRPDPALDHLHRAARHLGVGVDLTRVPSPFAAVVAATLRPGGGPAAGAAYAADVDPTAAAVATMLTLLGRVQVHRAGGRPVPAGPAELSPEPASGPVAEPVPDLVARLRAHGRDALCVETTPSDLALAGITTVRVLLTGRARR